MTEKLYVISLEYEIREKELYTAQCNKTERARFVKLKIKVTLVKATKAQRGGGRPEI
jgi:hypothetical protein